MFGGRSRREGSLVATIDQLATANTELLTSATAAIAEVTSERKEEHEYARQRQEEMTRQWQHLAHSLAQASAQEQQFHSVLQRDIHEVMTNMGLSQEDAINYLRRSIQSHTAS